MKKKNNRIEVRIAGSGGQGIQKMGEIIGEALTIIEKKDVVGRTIYGPQARGGDSFYDLIIGDTEYPCITKLDILVVMSNFAYEAYRGLLKNGGVLIIDEGTVDIKPDDGKNYKVCKIPATMLAERIGKKIVANVVMAGFLASVTKLIKFSSLEGKVEEAFPAQAQKDINKKALRLGYLYKTKGAKLLKKYQINISKEVKSKKMIICDTCSGDKCPKCWKHKN
jgi:2-oxoglutarate ferredoxin oxidoreductase subunit gamma